MAQLFHNNLIISFPSLLWTEVFIRLMSSREVAVCSLVLIFLKRWMKHTNTWSNGGCLVNYKTTVQENLPLLFHACNGLRGLHHSSFLILTYWLICRSQWFPLPPCGLPLLLAVLADREPEDATHNFMDSLAAGVITPGSGTLPVMGSFSIQYFPWENL